MEKKKDENSQEFNEYDTVLSEVVYSKHLNNKNESASADKILKDFQDRCNSVAKARQQKNNGEGK